MRYATHSFTAFILVLAITMAGCVKEFCTATVSWTDEFVDEEGRILLPVQVDEVLGRNGNALAQNSMEVRLMRVDSQGRAFEVASRIDVAFGVLGDISAYPIYGNSGSKDLLPIGYITPGGMPMQQFGLGGHAVPSGMFQIVSWTSIVQQFPSAIIGNVLVALTDVEIVRPDFGARLAALFTVSLAGRYQIEVDGLASPVMGSRVISSVEFPFQWTSPMFNLNPSGSTPGEGEGECEIDPNLVETVGSIDIVVNGHEAYADIDHHYNSLPAYQYIMDNECQEPEMQYLRYCPTGNFSCSYDQGTPFTRGNIRVNLADVMGESQSGCLYLVVQDDDQPNDNDTEGFGFYYANLRNWNITVNGEAIATPEDGCIQLDRQACNADTSELVRGSIDIVVNDHEAYADVDHHYNSLASYQYIMDGECQEPEMQYLRYCPSGDFSCSYDQGTPFTRGNIRVNLADVMGESQDGCLYMVVQDDDQPNENDTEGFGFWWANLAHWDITINGVPYATPTDGCIVIDRGETPVEQFTLTSSVVGQGTVSGAGTYNAGTEVTISATAATGWHFDHWTVNGTTGNSNPGTVQMNGDVALVAYFVQNDVEPPISTAPIVEFTRSGSTGTMRIFTDALTLREITADASAAYLPVGATFADISAIGVEIVNLPSPYWYLRESSSATMSAHNWSTTIQLDGVGTDSAGVAKSVPIANWVGGRAIPFYTIASVPGRIFSLNTGMNSGTLNGQALAVDTTGFIWPAS